MQNLKCEVKTIEEGKRLFTVEGETFPVIYSYPDEKAMWICDYDEEGRLTSVITCQGEKMVVYIDSAEKFLEARTEIEKEGWIRCKLPKVNVTFREPNGPSREERRRAEKEKEAEERKKKNELKRQKRLKEQRDAQLKKFEEIRHDE